MDRQKSLNRSRSSGEAKGVVAAHLIGRRCSPMLHPKLLRHLPHLPPSHTLCCCCCCCCRAAVCLSSRLASLSPTPSLPSASPSLLFPFYTSCQTLQSISSHSQQHQSSIIHTITSVRLKRQSTTNPFASPKSGQVATHISRHYPLATLCCWL